jgi:hypothetical protein
MEHHRELEIFFWILSFSSRPTAVKIHSSASVDALKRAILDKKPAVYETIAHDAERLALWHVSVFSPLL